MFKKLVTVVLALVMLVSAFAVAEGESKVIELGTSGFAITVDASYEKGEISAEDTDESQVAYYKSENYAMDFDVYQWAVAEGETLSAVAADEAVEYESEIVETAFNGIPVFYYDAIEESEGTEYPTTSYLMQNGDVFAEIVFWRDGEDADALVEAIMNTLTIVDDGDIIDEGNVIMLGTSALKIALPYVYVKGELSAEDTDEAQVAYYYSEECLVDFDIYQWAKAEGETLAEVIAAEAKDYNSEAAEMTVNDIVLGYYNAVEESEGIEYNTVSYMMEDGDDFVEIVFWLDGENAAEIVDAIIGSISR